MIHRLFNAATVLSLLLCISTVILWASSYTEADDIGWQVPYGKIGYDRWALNAVDGTAALHHTIRDDAPYTARAGRPQPQPCGPIWESWGTHKAIDHSIYAIKARNAIGFGWATHDWERYARYREWRVVFPLWLPTLLSAMVPALWATRRRRRKRREARGLCSMCGYDLRASSERCPECGAPIAQRLRTLT